ncbi:LysR substrate-binding domain-containing protein [Rhodococcus koreensis]|uniref:LysR substrate-binding domain-containing protein n=1 Tax=Rhodococcus koreensis TaxID=99653 RepID=UPI00197E509B|nr:LysR substrate-binding domain-containing protein [Rhodococcus koreensis]QSE86664.1 LysR family transcriptional regulator [Rhodococcus koreensis]
MLPDNDSLALFVQAAELQSLTKAAEASNIGLAGASRRIMLLEARLKTSLFDRTPRGMTLTPAGKWLLPQARSVLTQMHEMQLTLKDFSAGRQAVLRLLVDSSMMLEHFPEDLATFSKANADAELIVEECRSEKITRALRESGADLGIVVEGIPTSGLDAFVYDADRLAILAPAGHPVATKVDASFENLLDHDLVTLENGSSITRLLSERASLAGREFEPKVQVRSFEAICRMVQADLGVGILPLKVATLLATDIGAVVRPLHDNWAERKMFVCVKNERAANPLLSKLLKQLSSASERSTPTERNPSNLFNIRPAVA